MAEEPGIISDITTNILKFIPASKEATQAFKTLTGGVSEVLDKIKQNTEVIEDYRIKLSLASGATSDFTGKIREQTYALNKYGVSFGDVVNANIKMAESYSKATFTAAQTREQFEEDRIQVQKLLTVNEKFGASQEQTINLLNRLGNSVFTNTAQVSKFSDTLLKFSKETGQGFGKTLTEFDSYYKRFITSLDSDQATKSFTTLELLARRSGSSVNELVASISKFDDIDEAFATGGQINRVLSQFGGSFDTLAAANASEEEKAQMLLQSVAEIKDRFNATMTNPNARRQVLNEIVKQTGLPIETITGLLKEGQNLSADLQSIIKTPVTTKMEAIPEEDKMKMAVDVTKASKVSEIAQENLYMGPLSIAMEQLMNNQKTMTLNITSKLGEEVDKSFAKVIARKSDVVTFLGDLGTAAQRVGQEFMKQDVVNKIMSGGLSEVPGAMVDSFKKNIGSVASDKVQEAYNKHMETLARSDAAREKREETFRQKHIEAINTGITKAVGNMKIIGEVTVKSEEGKHLALGKLTNAAHHHR